MPPTINCTMKSSATTTKYLIVAFCDGVALSSSSGSDAGGVVCSTCDFDPKYQIMPPMPARRSSTLAYDHMIAAVVGWLPMSSSCGQFCVYVTALPGRVVEATHEVQKKNVA